jgi:hypothetical protein
MRKLLLKVSRTQRILHNRSMTKINAAPYLSEEAFKNSLLGISPYVINDEIVRFKDNTISMAK